MKRHIGITPEFEDGTCDVCKSKKNVRVVADKAKNLTFRICSDCAKSSTLTVEKLMEKYGKDEN